MEVKIKYFGMIAEEIGKEDEILTSPAIKSLAQWETELREIYPGLKSKTFRLALNQELKGLETEVLNGDELAILPAFAGG